MISIYNRYVGNRNTYCRRDGNRERCRRPQSQKPPAEDSGGFSESSEPGRGGLAGFLRGFLPKGLDTGDLLLLAVLLLLYLESEDEEFLIILLVIGYSIYKDGKEEREREP